MVRSGIVEAMFLQSPSQNVEEESGQGSSLSHVLIGLLSVQEQSCIRRKTRRATNTEFYILTAFPWHRCTVRGDHTASIGISYLAMPSSGVLNHAAIVEGSSLTEVIQLEENVHGH